MQRTTQFKLILSGAAVIIGLAVVELSLRAMPIARHYRVLVPNRRITTYPTPPHITGISGPSRYTSNEVGMRGRRWPGDRKGVYRILAVGGSTTQDVYLDDAEAWTALLEKELGRTSDGGEVWVGNVGKSGLSARDHAVQVSRLLDQHPQINVVLVLAGANDVLQALSQGDSYTQPPPITEPDAQRAQTWRAFEVVPRRLVEPEDLKGLQWYRRTGIWQGLRIVRASMRMRRMARHQAQDSTGASYDTWRAYRRGASELIAQAPKLDSPLEEYGRNLRIIAKDAAAHSTRLVLMSQPMIWRASMSELEERKLWLGGIGDFMSGPGHAYYTTEALAEAMSQYNIYLKDFCSRERIECFDLAAHIPRDTSIYYDDAHYTEHGAQEVAKAVASHFRTAAPFRAKPR